MVDQSLIFSEDPNGLPVSVVRQKPGVLRRFEVKVSEKVGNNYPEY